MTNPLLIPSPFEADAGQMIGADPSGLAPDDFEAAGVELLPIMKAVRAKCLDCVGGNPSEVRKCVSIICPLWPVRMGAYPARLRAAANGSSGKNSPERTDSDESEAS